MVIYQIDYRSPPSYVGWVRDEDGTITVLPYEDEETGGFSTDYELKFIREHAVTHVIDTEADLGERDHFAPIPIETWMSMVESFMR